MHQSPDAEDWRKLMRVIGYLKKNPDKRLVLKAQNDIKINAYVDASFGLHRDGKSHSGMVVYLGDAPLYFSSTKQKIVAKDSTEAELVGLSDSLGMVGKIRDFISNQGYHGISPNIYQDNLSTISLVTKGGGKPRAKHKKARQYMVKEMIDNKEIQVHLTKSEFMVADALTK